MALIFLFFIYFFSFYVQTSSYSVTLKIRVGNFSGTFKVRILKLGIHMDNELLYCGIENQTPCSYSSLYLSICLSFKAYFCHSFFRNCAS